MTFSPEKVEKLRKAVEKRLGKKRFLHTLGVAKSAVKLAQMCENESKCEAEIAGLLHDITKELTFDEQISILQSHSVKLDCEDLECACVLHSFTAPLIIKADFSEFATEKVLSAVRNHTIGSPDMSVFDEIIFLADFIEETRTYDACVLLRDFVFKNMKPGDYQNNVRILHLASVSAIDRTIINLIENKKAINSKNILTRNALLSKI